MGSSLLFPGAVNSEKASEYDLKAAFLYNFSNFVTWPKQANPFIICVYGDNPFNTSLEALLTEKSADTIYRAAYPDRLEALHACHILYISRSKLSELPEIIASLASQPVLTVGDFTQSDGHSVTMINLLTNEQHIGFEINHSAAQASGLQIDSKLLALAKRVF